jgi:hypothetical protein
MLSQQHGAVGLKQQERMSVWLHGERQTEHPNVGEYARQTLTVAYLDDNIGTLHTERTTRDPGQINNKVKDGRL